MKYSAWKTVYKRLDATAAQHGGIGFYRFPRALKSDATYLLSHIRNNKGTAEISYHKKSILVKVWY